MIFKETEGERCPVKLQNSEGEDPGSSERAGEAMLTAASDAEARRPA